MWHEEFLTLLSGKTISLQQIEQAHALKNRNLPKKLFKFREATDYALDNLKNDTVWACSTDHYNDPYECSTTIGFDRLDAATSKTQFEKISTEVNLRQHLTDEEIQTARDSSDPLVTARRLLLEKDASIPENLHDGILQAIREIMGDHYDNLLHQLNAYLQQGTKVCSFSTRNDSILMWSHYAKDHTGFCIEYDVDQWPGDGFHRRALYPVVYSSEQFDITEYIAQSTENIKNFNNLFGIVAATRKAQDWSYENEWRFVIPAGESYSNRNLPMPGPSAIYLGARARAGDSKTLTEIAMSKRIPVFQMRLSNKEFRMTPEPISIAGT